MSHLFMLLVAHTNKAVEQKISNSILLSESYEYSFTATNSEYYKAYCIGLNLNS